MDIQLVVLQGRWVRLEPLLEEHIPQLAEAGRDDAIWQFMRYGEITTEAGMRSWVMELLEAQTRGTDLPFAVIHLASGVAIGSTRYLEIRQLHRSLEIGGTWYALAHQRTAVNTECKYLLLRHAFESLGCLRVQFKTDLRNERSQRALQRIGAVKEGVLRNHMILPDGTIRHSVYYSIIDSEWPEVKSRLEEKLGSYA
jgi:RimJ/RimL family protein N-acetyltransferase